MEKSLQKVDSRYKGTDDRPERRRKPIRPKVEKDYSELLQEVAANEHKLDGRVPVGDVKDPAGPQEAAPTRRSPRGPRRPRTPDPSEPRRRRKRKSGAGGRIDGDPFMRCFLREVDTNCDTEGDVLYLYPIVEYRGGASDDDDEEGGGVYRCAACEGTFPDATQLRDHMLWLHVDERSNRCGACGLGFETAFRARAHVLAEHVDLDCRFCPGRFPDGSSLRRHVTLAHGDRPRPRPDPFSDPKRCEVCLEAFFTPAELAEHVETEHASLLEHRCDLCSRTFLDEDELFAHVDRDPHVCLLCSAYFESTLGLRQHLLGHATDRRVLQLFTAAEMPAS